MSTEIMMILTLLFFVVVLGDQKIERLDPMKKCVDTYSKQTLVMDYHEYAFKCSFVCIVDGYGNKSTSFQQPDGVLCHEDLPESYENNWMCYKGQCVTKEAVDACKEIANGEENITSVVYQLCNIVCLVQENKLPHGQQEEYQYNRFFNSSESCFKRDKLGKCSKIRSCMVPKTNQFF